MGFFFPALPSSLYHSLWLQNFFFVEEELELVLRPKVPKPLSVNKGSADPILKPKPSLPLKQPHPETLFKENPSLLLLGTTGSSRTSSGSRKDGAMARPGSEAELQGELGSHQPQSCAGSGARSPSSSLRPLPGTSVVSWLPVAFCRRRRDAGGSDYRQGGQGCCSKQGCGTLGTTVPSARAVGRVQGTPGVLGGHRAEVPPVAVVLGKGCGNCSHRLV